MSALLRYAVKKILIGIPVVFFVTVILFVIMQLMPGDPIDLILPPGSRVSEERIQEIKRAWGLDKPLFVQYFYWLSHILRGDFGYSYVTKLPVSDLLYARIPYTLELMLTSQVLAYLLGIPLGVIAALRRAGLADSLIMVGTAVLWSTPGYWLGIMLMLTFGFYLRVLPISGAFSPASIVLPVATLTLPYLAMVARLMRTEMLEVLSEDYIRTAWAKGLPSRRVVLRHALRNALIPVTVLFFLELPWLLGGAVVVEVVFAWPGMGTLLYESIVRQDYPVVMAIIFIIAILTVICNTLGDIVSAILDPRIRLEKGEY